MVPSILCKLLVTSLVSSKETCPISWDTKWQSSIVPILDRAIDSSRALELSSSFSTTFPKNSEQHKRRRVPSSIFAHMCISWRYFVAKFSEAKTGEWSSTSKIPSLSSSVSVDEPFPSKSKSAQSRGSLSNWSRGSDTPSLSSSVSLLSPIESASKSLHSEGFESNTSISSTTPSLSSSKSQESPDLSKSKSDWSGLW